jgi:hypothetical protein
MTGFPKLAAYYTIPFVAFAKDDPAWILTVLPSRAYKSIPEFLFANFNERSPDEISGIVGYLVKTLVAPSCDHRLESIADCLIYGAGHYPDYFSSARATVVLKCWKWLDSEVDRSRIDKLTTLCGTFMCIPMKRDTIQPRMEWSTMNDDTGQAYIGGMLDAISRVAKLPLNFK